MQFIAFNKHTLFPNEIFSRVSLFWFILCEEAPLSSFIHSSIDKLVGRSINVFAAHDQH